MTDQERIAYLERNVNDLVAMIKSLSRSIRGLTILSKLQGGTHPAELVAEVEALSAEAAQ